MTEYCIINDRLHQMADAKGNRWEPVANPHAAACELWQENAALRAELDQRASIGSDVAAIVAEGETNAGQIIGGEPGTEDPF